MKTKIVYDKHRSRDLTGLTWIRVPADGDTADVEPAVESKDAPPAGPSPDLTPPTFDLYGDFHARADLPT